METKVTEKTYPITILWVFKGAIILFPFAILSIFFGDFRLIAFLIFSLIANPLIRMNFHFSVEEKFFVVNHGVLSKQHRNLPYGVIQNILIKQDLFDRIFGLATFSVENAVQMTAVARNSLNYGNSRGQGQAEFVGSSGNKVNLPGLKRADAEALKFVILNKMEENPVEDNNSGL